jgi:hypothetical protein
MRATPPVAALVLASSLFLTACGGREEPPADAAAPAVAPAPASEPASPPEEAAKPEPPPEPAAAAGMEGAWVLAGGACDSGQPVTLAVGGIYSSEDETGRWSRDGDRLTIVSEPIPTGDPAAPETGVAAVATTSVLTIEALSGDAARLRTSDGATLNWTRCSPP